MTHYILPYPPSVNHIWGERPGPGRRRYLKPEGRAYHEAVKERTRGIKDHKRAGPVTVYCDFYPPDNRRRDSHNGLKILLDSLVLADVLSDDSDKVIRETVLKVRAATKESRVVVRIENFDGEGE